MTCAWKISVFGAGGTGSAIAQALTVKGYEEVVLVDVEKDLAEGRAMDIAQSGCFLGSDTHVIGGSDVELTKNSDVVVITAGIGRKPGLQREELLVVNGQVMQEIGRTVRLLSRGAFVIVLTNPADILARIVLEATQFPAHRVMAQGGILDSARLCHWIAQLAGVSQQHVRAMILGGHGDHMVPVRRFASVYGVPATDLLTEDAWQTAVQHARFGGGEILAKFKTHGAAITPAHAVVTMIDALQSPLPQILPVSVRSNGVYGLPQDVFIGLPTKLSQRGVVEVLELPLAPEEHEALLASALTMQRTYEAWKSTQSS